MGEREHGARIRNMVMKVSQSLESVSQSSLLLLLLLLLSKKMDALDCFLCVSLSGFVSYIINSTEVRHWRWVYASINFSGILPLRAAAVAANDFFCFFYSSKKRRDKYNNKTNMPWGGGGGL